MDDPEAEAVKKRIADEGRSPTMIVNCSDGHELLITLYMNGGKLAVRDVVVPMRAEDEDTGDDKSSSEIDWLKKTFGGDS
ncbi:MAG: hypothetical protein GF309_01245 [Candidatus Lokiarchaeota archaeon]|nr:hypothetical protein [Candidatus Lokiarchaeota archaeon]